MRTSVRRSRPEPHSSARSLGAAEGSERRLNVRLSPCDHSLCPELLLTAAVSSVLAAVATVRGYSRMLRDFFGGAGKPPDQVTAQEVFLWAHGQDVSGTEPSPVTVAARMACLSSFLGL